MHIKETGLLRNMSEPCFKFIEEMVHKILSCLSPPDSMLQFKDMDLLVKPSQNLTSKLVAHQFLSLQMIESSQPDEGKWTNKQQVITQFQRPVIV